MKKKRKSARRRRTTFDGLSSEILTKMNPSEPASPMMGLAAQLEKDMFSPEKNLDVKKDADPKQPGKPEESCAMKDFLTVVGALAIAASIVYGGVLGYGYLTRPAVGECYNHWLFSTKARVESVKGDNVHYQYARYESYPGDIGFNDRTLKSFDESFPKKVDCSKFFDLREEVRHDKDFEDYIGILKKLRSQLDEEKAKNANRSRKR